jgi:hypothetical protein
MNIVQAKKEGYDGIEICGYGKKDRMIFLIAEKNGLEVGFLCGGSDYNYEKHFE